MFFYARREQKVVLKQINYYQIHLRVIYLIRVRNTEPYLHWYLPVFI